MKKTKLFLNKRFCSKSFDPDGSYTGVYTGSSSENDYNNPVQDADDL